MLGVSGGFVRVHEYLLFATYMFDEVSYEILARLLGI